MILKRRLIAILATGFVAACGGDEAPMGPEERVVLTNPSFSTDIQEIILRRGCTAGQCHGDGAGGMTLSSSASANHAAWVGVASTSEPGFLRVEPGDPDNSYVVIKLEGRQSVGARMPLGGAPTDDIDIANIRNWIAAGAQNN
jgi:hypothetical protein